jgi:hypothetical protein
LKRGRVRKLAVMGVIGTTFVYVAASKQARTRLIGTLHEAWERSVQTTRAALAMLAPDASEAPLTAWEAAQATTAPPVEVRPVVDAEPVTEPEPSVPELVVSEQAETVAVPEAPVPEAPVPEAVEPRAGGANGAPRRRRHRARAAALVAAAGAAVAAGAAAWAIWGTSSDGDSKATAPSASGESVLAAVSKPGAKRLPVSGSAGKLILVVGRDGKAALIVSGFGRAPQGKQFEAWVIVGKSAKRAGLFAGGPGSVVVPLSESVPKGATVAITLERTGGVDAPTGKPVFAAKAS